MIAKTLGFIVILAAVVLMGTGRSLTARPDSAGDVDAGIDVKHITGKASSLDAAWNWALGAAKNQTNGFYAGYLIKRESKRKGTIHIGCKHGKSSKVQLGHLIYGKKWDGHEDGTHYNRVAVLFRFKSSTGDRFAFEKLKVISLESQVTLKNIPLYWMGTIDTGQSLDFLTRVFNMNSQAGNREKVVAAVGVHGTHPKAFQLLKKATRTNYPDEIRKDAVFWLAQQKNKETVAIILDLYKNDKSYKVRKQTIFALYLVNTREADTALIKIARKGDDTKFRKNAIFWLGQRAGQRMAKVLGDVVDDEDEETGIKSAAVFALSQMPNGVDKLIKIATTHKSIKIRKKALFWLGESGDPRALETIEKILMK